MVVVLDVFNDYPIGYAVGSHECPELIKAALRNAAIHSRELMGEMLRAYQIQSDRYAIKTMHDLYAVMGGKVTPAQAHNAKSKTRRALLQSLEYDLLPAVQQLVGLRYHFKPEATAKQRRTEQETLQFPR